MRDTVSAERLLAAVRVHADRVHDLVRRLGGTPEMAVTVVEESALELVDAVAGGGAPDVVGWWVARARELVATVAPEHADVPVGAGVLSTDSDQALLGAALEGLPEPQRVALLLRDSYDLPAETVAAALATTPDDALVQVGAARLAFLPGIDDEPVPPVLRHPGGPGALARLGEGGAVSTQDAAALRHVSGCDGCRSVVEAQDYAHRLLAGLVVVALPAAARAHLLEQVEQAAERLLPPSVSVLLTEVDDVRAVRAPRVLSPWAVVGGLLLAGAVGAGAGLLLARPQGIDPSRAAGTSTLVRPAPLPTLTSPPPAQVQRAASPPTPDTRVFTLAPVTPSPSPSPSPPPAPSPSPSPSPQPPADRLGLSVDPSSGAGGQEVTVSGTGWTAGAEVRVDYLDPVGTPTGSSATAVADERGRFTVPLATVDPQNLPGAHSVRARAGGQEASADYEVTG